MTHGTRTGYASQGCRCNACKDAQAAYMRRWNQRNPKKLKSNQRRRKKRVLATGPHKRGSVSMYTAGCRCAGCTRAMARYHQKRVQKK